VLLSRGFFGKDSYDITATKWGVFPPPLSSALQCNYLLTFIITRNKPWSFRQTQTHAHTQGYKDSTEKRVTSIPKVCSSNHGPIRSSARAFMVFLGRMYFWWRL